VGGRERCFLLAGLGSCGQLAKGCEHKGTPGRQVKAVWFESGLGHVFLVIATQTEIAPLAEQQQTINNEIQPVFPSVPCSIL
jgi:hypothetical protein